MISVRKGMPREAYRDLEAIKSLASETLILDPRSRTILIEPAGHLGREVKCRLPLDLR